MVSVSYLFPFVMFYKIKIIKKGNSLQNAIAVEIFHSYHFNFLYATLYSYVLFVANKTFFIKNFFSFTHFYKCLHFIFILFLAGFFYFFFGNKGKKYNFMCVKFIFVLSLIISEKRIKNIYFFKYFFFLLQTLSNSADVCALDILLVLHLSVHHDACTHRLFVTLYAAAFWLQLSKNKSVLL